MLENYESLTIRQSVEMLQVFIGLETRNRYRILDPEDNEVLYSYEESGFMSRQFLGGHRPLTLNIIDSDGKVLMVAPRSFFWFFSHLELLSPEGDRLGGMQRRFKFVGRRFNLHDTDQQVATIEGPLFRPYTFWIRRDGVELARVTKRWSGISREMFTAADTFKVEFTDSTLSESMRWLVLGAAFAIDLDFFERRHSSGFGLGALGVGGFGGGRSGGGGIAGRGF